MRTAIEAFLRSVSRFFVIVAVAARVSAYAVSVAALWLVLRDLIEALALLKFESLLVWFLLVVICGFSVGVVLLIEGTHDAFLRTSFAEATQADRELAERVLTPIAFSLGSLILFWLLSSQPIDIARLLRQQDLRLALALGYLLAPTLIRTRLLAKCLEHLGGT